MKNKRNLKVVKQQKTVVTEVHSSGILHSARCISILDNLVATSAAAFFAGIIIPQWGEGPNRRDWAAEGMLAFSVVFLYAVGVVIQWRLNK